VIAGSQTLMINSNGLEYDARTNQFLVFTNVVVAPTGPPALLFFPRTPQGDVAPSRQLGGASTGVGVSYGALAASLDLIFDDGFNPGP
jgi:hypothetical protein